MARHLILLALGASTLVGCARISDSSANPFNWLDRAEKAEAVPQDLAPLVPAAKEVLIVDQRAPAQSIQSLERARVDGGVLLTAQVLSSRPGPYNAELVIVGSNGTTLTLEPRMQYPVGSTSTGQAPVTVGKFLSPTDLGGTTQIVVRTLTNQRSLRR